MSMNFFIKILLLINIPPNPFNPLTNIKFTLPKASYVKITIYNCIGQLISEIANGWFEEGNQNIEFNGFNLPSGVYFYKIEAGQFTQTRKMLLLK